MSSRSRRKSFGCASCSHRSELHPPDECPVRIRLGRRPVCELPVKLGRMNSDEGLADRPLIAERRMHDAQRTTRSSVTRRKLDPPHSVLNGLGNAHTVTPAGADLKVRPPKPGNLEITG